MFSKYAKNAEFISDSSKQEKFLGKNRIKIKKLKTSLEKLKNLLKCLLQIFLNSLYIFF